MELFEDFKSNFVTARVVVISVAEEKLAPIWEWHQLQVIQVIQQPKE